MPLPSHPYAPVLCLAVVAALILTGCAAPPRAPAEDAYTLTLSNVPGLVRPNEEFSFTLFVTGAVSSDTDHVGAHYGFNSTSEPSTTIYDKACVHRTGSLPSSFLVTCTPTAIGLIQLRGHARVTVGETVRNYWSDEVAIPVAPTERPAYVLVASAPPTQVAAGQAFTFQLQIDGPQGHSDHIGGHFGPNSTSEPTVPKYPLACVHQVSKMPATFTVSCTAPSPGTYYLRGHMRLMLGPYTWNYFGSEYVVTAT